MSLAQGISGLLDRRQHARYVYRRTVAVEMPPRQTVEAQGHDISRGGIRLSLPRGVAPGDRVALGLRLANDLWLGLQAEIRFVAPVGDAAQCLAGLRFVGADDVDVEVLDEVIAELRAENANLWTADCPVSRN